MVTLDIQQIIKQCHELEDKRKNDENAIKDKNKQIKTLQDKLSVYQTLFWIALSLLIARSIH